MPDFVKSLRKLVLLVAGGFFFILLLVVFNQSVQLIASADRVDPLLGKLTSALLLLVFGLMILLPIAFIASLRKKPELPAESGSPEYQQYIRLLQKRLRGNAFLQAADFAFDDQAEPEAEVARATALLDVQARRVIRENASAVFLTTAISQNGVLDGAFVLASIARMTWQVARIYNQRPSLRELIILYGNIGATVLMARGIDDLDLMDEQLEPIIASVLGGGLANLIPGAVTVTNLIVNSISEGAVNALLALRVGCLTQRYCASTTKADLKKLRRSATLEACSLLGSIMKENSLVIIKSFGTAAKRATQRTFKLKSE